MAKTPKKHGGKRVGAGRKPAHKEGKTTVIGVSVPESLVAALDGWAESRGKTRSEAATEAIRRLTAHPPQVLPG